MSYRAKTNYKRLGNYIELVDERNVDLEITLLLGLSISKQFIPSVANIIGSNMKNYKIIRKGQFACSIMQVRRDGKMPVALLEEYDEAIISQAYPVFRVIDESLLLPEYLMMWFSRSEFDRQATFHAVGGVRGSLEWEDFMNFELPIPSIEKQNEIVKEYNTIVNRIALNETLNQKLEETAQALYKHWFVDFEFPNEDGEPYKSSGGEMIYCEEVDGEVPAGWNFDQIGDVVEIVGGGTPSTTKNEYWNKGNVNWFSPTDITNSSSIFCFDSERKITKIGLNKSSAKLFPSFSLMMTSRATIGKIGINTVDSCTNQGFITIIPNDEYPVYFLTEWLKTNLKTIESLSSGSTFKEINRTNFKSLKVLNSHKTINIFNSKLILLYNTILLNSKESKLLKMLESLLLSKMTKVE